MRKFLKTLPTSDSPAQTKHESGTQATSWRKYAVTTKRLSSTNNTSWGHLYSAITEGLNISPKSFQMVYPFISWGWPVTQPGYTGSAQWDFCSSVPQFSATGRYTSAGTAFNDAYRSVLNLVAANTSNPVLQEKIIAARDQLTEATDYYDKTYQQAKEAYEKETGGTNDPSFTTWLGSYGGKSWAVQLDSAGKNVDAQQAVLNQLISETETPGLQEAIDRYENEDYYTKFEDDTLEKFPLVPDYSISMTSAEWLQKVQAGTGESKGSISFSNSQPPYNYSQTWAGACRSIDKFFWSANVGGAWQRAEKFIEDSLLKVKISFEAWDQIPIDAGCWYNQNFIDYIKDGPFVHNYSAYGIDGTQAVWGKDGIMKLQKVAMLVCYKPHFEILASRPTFDSFLETWNICSGIQIGPFDFKGGGGNKSSNWNADSNFGMFSGTSTSEEPLIFGVLIRQINPF